MLKYLNNIVIAVVILLGIGLNTCYATVLTDSSGDFVTDSSNDPVSDTNGPPLIAPSITTQPVSITVMTSATATFTVAAVGNPAPYFQWQEEPAGASSFTVINGARSASYTTPVTTIANNGTLYECVVSSALGNVTSITATLFVDAVPNIIAQPASVSVLAPVTATFNLLATGFPAPAYQWKQELPGANTFTVIDGATSASYTIPATTTANNGTQYECVISNSSGTVTSNIATLTVSALPAITTQPANTTVTAPATATFTVAATGSPAPRYQWMQEAPGASTFTTIGGATSASYTTPATTIANNGTQYECVISNTIGVVTSNAGTLTVNALPSIITQPVNVTVAAPLTATFTVTATGSPTLMYQWMQEALGAGTFTAISGATSASYTTPATTTANNGTQYECVVSNPIGSVTSNAAKISIVVPAILSSAPIGPQPFSLSLPITVTTNENMTCKYVASTGAPGPPGTGPSYASMPNTFATTGGTVHTQWISTLGPINALTSYQYYYIACKDQAGNLTQNNYAIGFIVSPPPVPSVPTLSVSLSPDGKYNVLSWTASSAGQGVPIIYIVYRILYINGKDLGSFQEVFGGIPSLTWTDTTAQSGITYQYEIRAVDSIASTQYSTSNIVTATKLTPGAPTIPTPLTNQTVTAPATATFTVVAAGAPTLNYQWMQEAPGANTFTIISGATSALYTTPATTPANSGTSYECVVTNAIGNVTSNPGLLTVNSIPTAPTITSQPASAIVTAPATATFTVAATGSPAPRYQWMQEVSGADIFTAISGATSTSYTTPATTISNSGTSYECVVTNTLGTVTSASATLTVNPTPTAPVIITQPVNATVTAPITATFTVAATATPTPMYQWMQEASGDSTFTAISGATSTSYTTPATTTANSGVQYECVITNTAGSVTSNAATLTVKPTTSYVQSISYNANGQMTQIQYGNGITTSYTYNPLNFHLMRIYTSNAQAQVIQDLNYTYDSIGQVLSVTDNVNTGPSSMNQTFAYDALNRLTSASGSYGSKTYAYDCIGNIRQKDGLTYKYAESGSRIDGSAAGPHAVTSLSDGTTFQYDANGNMLNLQKGGGKSTQYAYDSQNRLQSVTVGGLTAATYTYDGDGGRTQKTVYHRDLAIYNDNTDALLFGSATNPLPATAQNPTVDTTVYVGNLYETESGTSRNTNFIYLGDTKVASVDNSGNVFYYHADHLGGANVMTDASGEVRELTEYDPFGQILIHEKYGSDFATAWYYFTGKPLDDETGLIYLGARYYNPALGRFITPDTEVQAPEDPQTLNRYTYCNNNPVNLLDPTGHSWWSKFWQKFGDFISPLIRAIVTGDWGHFAQQVLNIATIVIGALTSNPYLIASGAISFFNTATSSFQGGGWNTFHQVAGYTAIALAVIGAFQSSATTQAFKPVKPGDVSPDFSPVHAPDNLSSVLNNPNLGIVDKAKAAVTIANNTQIVVMKAREIIATGPQAVRLSGSEMVESFAHTISEGSTSLMSETGAISSTEGEGSNELETAVNMFYKVDFFKSTVVTEAVESLGRVPQGYEVINEVTLSQSNIGFEGIYYYSTKEVAFEYGPAQSTSEKLIREFVGKD